MRKYFASLQIKYDSSPKIHSQEPKSTQSFNIQMMQMVWQIVLTLIRLLLQTRLPPDLSEYFGSLQHLCQLTSGLKFCTQLIGEPFYHEKKGNLLLLPTFFTFHLSQYVTFDFALLDRRFAKLALYMFEGTSLGFL